MKKILEIILECIYDYLNMAIGMSARQFELSIGHMVQSTRAYVGDMAI